MNLLWKLLLLPKAGGRQAQAEASLVWGVASGDEQKKNLKDSWSGRGLDAQKVKESRKSKVFFCLCDKRF